MNLHEFFNMGGYAFYVWTSYGLWALVMFLNLFLSRAREKQVRRRLQERIES